MNTKTEPQSALPTIFAWDLNNVTLEDILGIYVPVPKWQTRPRNPIKNNPLADVNSFPVSVPKATPEMLQRLRIFAAV